MAVCEQHHWNICNVGELPTNTSKAYFNLCLQFIYQHIFASVQPRNLSQRPYIASSSKVAFPFIIESCLDGKKTAGLIRPSFTYTIFLFHGLCCFFIPVLKLSYKQYMRIFPWTMFLFSFTSLPPVASSPFFMNTPKLLLHLYILVKQIYCYGVIFQKKFQTIKETWYLFMITTMTIVVINSKPMLITYIQLRCHNNIIWTSTHI